MKKPSLSLTLLLCLLLNLSVQADVAITVEKGLLKEPFTGRIYVVIAPEREGRLPLQANYWFAPLEILAKDVENFKAGDVINISRDDLRYLKPMAGDKPYALQALFRLNTRDANPFHSQGNLYSEPLSLDKSAYEALDLEVQVNKRIDDDSPLAEQRPPESNRLKYHAFESQLLSEFHDEPYFVDMAVHLPKDFDADSDKTYPVLYYVTGMGGNEVEMLRVMRGYESYMDHYILVSVDAMSYGGHSVFADSANTGPWGAMLTEEIIPFVDKTYRGKGAESRYVTGISSGGWSSLWLQVRYPEVFAGVWSFVPDPIDFRDFQRINLYASDQNLYRNNLGEERLVARTGSGQPLIKYQDFISLETVMGEGGQIRSFEYVFSPRGEDGKPIPFFDRQTGKINREVVEAWKPYDIRLYLKQNWADLKDVLKGKLHVYGGERDQFFLEGPVRLLREELIMLGAEEDVRVIEGMTHSFHPEAMEDMLKTITGQQSKPSDPK